LLRMRKMCLKPLPTLIVSPLTFRQVIRHGVVYDTCSCLSQGIVLLRSLRDLEAP
jgi:hypothetical protein